MKKVLVVILILSLAIVMVACGEQKEPLDMAKAKISYEEKSHIVGENDNYGVEIVSVKGEKVPTLDGKVDEVSERCIVKVMVKNLDCVEKECAIKLVDGEHSATLTLPKDVLGMSYSTSATKDVVSFLPSKAMIKGKDGEETIDLCSVLKNANMDNGEAITLAYNAVKDDIATYFSDKEYLGEVVIKLIHSKNVTASPYYYYVAFVRAKDNYVACLIDPVEKKIVNTKKKSLNENM